MKDFKPFIINSNLCYEEKDVATFDNYMKSIQYNIGNSYITYSLIKELCGGFKKVPHIQNIYYYDFANVDADIEYINSECTHVFFMIQDFIRINEFPLPYEKLIDMFSRINKPLIVAGIGANSFASFDNKLHKKLKPVVVKFLKYLSDRCVQIGVRGFYTEEVLNNLGIHNVTAMGCPSFYEMGRERKVVKKPIDETLRGGGGHILLSSALVNKYLYDNIQICQDFQESNIIKAIAFNDFDNVLVKEQLERVFNKKFMAFSNIDDWRSFVSGYRFVIGSRVHGSILSLNAGVPAVCRNGDTRAAEMCRLLRVPVRTNLGFETDIIKLYEEVDVDAMNSSYPALYDNYVEFLHKNGLSICEPSGSDVYDVQPSLELYKDFKDDEEWKNSVRLRVNLATVRKNNEDLLSKIETLNCKCDELLKFQRKPKLLQKIFSIKNEGKHKVLRFLGIKFKFRRTTR